MLGEVRLCYVMLGNVRWDYGMLRVFRLCYEMLGYVRVG